MESTKPVSAGNTVERFAELGAHVPASLPAHTGYLGDGALSVTSVAAPGGLALRHVARSEVPAICVMWERCSRATRTTRFHAPVRDLPAAYLEAVLADPTASVLAARDPAGDVVGLASLIGTQGPGTAELGVLVEDAWQRRGIGRQLVAHLIAAAPARGITTLTAAVLAGNAGVADLLRQVPGQFSLVSDGETLNVQVRLASSQAHIVRSSSSDRAPGRAQTAARCQPDAANSAS